MFKLFYFIKKAFTPITIMVIPHENIKSLSIKLPFSAIILTMVLCAVGSIQVFSLASRGLDYPLMAEKVNYFSRQFGEWNTTMMGLKKTEQDFQRLFALGSKEKILENMETSFSGDIDWDSLKQEIERAVTEVNEIKDYLRVQKDIYLATPKGYPVQGNVTSGYGKRENPITQMADFHSGIDISASSGTSIQATADGVVNYSDWTAHSGNVVILKHGFGFSTVYAHNKKNVVKVGQKIKRGDLLGYVGSTGKSTGPHVHYEIWTKGKAINPRDFLQGGA